MPCTPPVLSASKPLKLLALVLFSFGSATIAAATTIQIDFANSTTAPGGNWVTITQGLINQAHSSLIDFETGEATSISVQGSGFFGHGTSGWQGGNVGWIDANAAADYVGGDSSSTFTFSNLSIGKFSLELISSSSGGGSPFTSIYVNGMLADRTGLGSGDSYKWNYQTAYADSNWLIWDEITPINDQIQITFFGAGDAILNAVRLSSVSAIPEPSTYAAFAGAAVLAFAAFRRKNGAARRPRQAR